MSTSDGWARRIWGEGGQDRLRGAHGLHPLTAAAERFTQADTVSILTAGAGVLALGGTVAGGAQEGLQCPDDRARGSPQGELAFLLLVLC